MVKVLWCGSIADNFACLHSLEPFDAWHADNPMRPYVAFNAELRAAFQGCIARMEEHCAALVRHELEVATSAFARRISLASLSLEDDDCENMQNVPPAPPTQVLHDRAGHNIPPPTQTLQDRCLPLVRDNKVNTVKTCVRRCEDPGHTLPYIL